jgi:hypothetical protein
MFLGTQFLYLLRQNYPGSGHYSPPLEPRGYNVIAGQGVRHSAVWQSNCYRELWVLESNGGPEFLILAIAASALAGNAQ